MSSRASLFLLALALAGSGCGSSSSGAGGSGGGGAGGGGAGGGGAAGPDGGTSPDSGSGQDASPAPNADGGGAGGSVGTSVAMADFTSKYAGAYCQRVEQCCMPMGGFDLESCLNGIKGTADVLVTSYQPYVDMGKAVYRPENAAACINASLAASCAEIQNGSAALNQVLDACAVAFESSVAPGGACMDDLECKAGWCGPDGKCIARKPEGAACEDDGDCTSDNCSTISMTCMPRGVEGLCP